MTLVNAGVRAQQVQVAGLYARLLPPEVFTHKKDYFAYGNSFLPLPSGQRSSLTFAIESNSDFLCVALAIDIRTTAAIPVPVVDPAVLCLLTASASGRNSFNQDMPISAIFGTGQLPMYLPYPLIMRASSTFETQLVNQQGVDLQIRTVFHGFKVFGQ